MNSVVRSLLVGGVVFAASGCGPMYPYGGVYNGVTTPHSSTRVEIGGAAKGGDKAGEACATGIMGLAAWGDASTDAAKKAGGITEVHSEEFRHFGILGIYSQGCTEVHGK